MFVVFWGMLLPYTGKSKFVLLVSLFKKVLFITTTLFYYSDSSKLVQCSLTGT